MRLPLNRDIWQLPLWWLPVFTLALLLKQHYSIAHVSELEWMLRPLSDLLALITGYEFHRDINGEWFSITADVRLVKSCAGINFMLMSLLAFAWSFRPDRKEKLPIPSLVGGYPLLLGAICVAAWGMALFANTLRILLAMHLQSNDSIIEAIGIDASTLHRFIGLAVYLPLLTLQMLPGNRISRRQVMYIPALLYAVLMILIPLLTGNALRNPTLFIEHVLQLGVGIAITLVGLHLLFKRQQI
jgi:exosortase K